MGYGDTPDEPSASGSAMSGGMKGGIYGALAGLLNYQLFQKPQYERQMQLAATTQRLNPWTHMQANVPGAVNPLGSALSLGAAGAQYGQNQDQANQQNSMNNAYLGYLKQFSPGGSGGGGAAAPTTGGGYSSGYGLPATPYNSGPALPPGYLQNGGWGGGR